MSECLSLSLSLSVAAAYLYSAPQPLTKLMRMVHILVSWYTASNPWLTDCASKAANSWLLKIFRLHPEGNNQDTTKRQVTQQLVTISLALLYLEMYIRRGTAFSMVGFKGNSKGDFTNQSLFRGLGEHYCICEALRCITFNTVYCVIGVQF